MIEYTPNCKFYEDGVERTEYTAIFHTSKVHDSYLSLPLKWGIDPRVLEFQINHRDKGCPCDRPEDLSLVLHCNQRLQPSVAWQRYLSPPSHPLFEHLPGPNDDAKPSSHLRSGY